MSPYSLSPSDNFSGVSTISFSALPDGVSVFLNNLDSSGAAIVNVIGSSTGNNTIMGNAADNQLTGGSGNDVLRGAYGNDMVWGNGGDDTLYGGPGDDRIDGGTGNDILYGVGGNDTYVFAKGYGHDTISNSGPSGPPPVPSK